MNNKEIITISGLPGSGTTTAANILSKRTGMELISSGEVFRNLAKEHGVSLEEFGEMAEKKENIDRELDETMLKSAEPGTILEGRLTGHLLAREGIDSYKIWIRADMDTRVKRISERESLPVDEVKERVIKREQSEKKRYKEYYDIDIQQLDVYDLIIDSVKHGPEEVVDKMMEGVEIEVCEG